MADKVNFVVQGVGQKTPSKPNAKSKPPEPKILTVKATDQGMQVKKSDMATFELVGQKVKASAESPFKSNSKRRLSSKDSLRKKESEQLDEDIDVIEALNQQQQSFERNFNMPESTSHQDLSGSAKMKSNRMGGGGFKVNTEGTVMSRVPRQSRRSIGAGGRELERPRHHNSSKCSRSLRKINNEYKEECILQC